jgi:lipoprotein-releasing system permease protein
MSDAPTEEPGPPKLDFDALPPVPDGSPHRAEVWLAMSHLRGQKHAFLSVVTFLAITGVVVGVAVLNMVLSVMTGFEVDLRDKILGTNAHIVVLRYGGNVLEPADAVERIEAIEGVDAAAPFVYTELMVRSAWGSSGVVVKGIDPDRTYQVTSLRDDLEYGPGGELTTDEERAELFAGMSGTFGPREGADGEDAEQLPGILVGRELMEQLQVYPGDRVQLINPLGGGAGIMGMPTPSVRPARVAGVFYSGMYEYDTKWTYVANSTVQEFLKIGDQATGIEVKVEDIDDVEDVSKQIEETLGYPYYAKHWKTLNRALFEALELEKWVMGLILSMIVLVAGLLIVTTLIMVVITKGRQIAILKAMGAAPISIQRVFILEGSLIGGAGTLIGTVLGYVGCLGLDRYEYPLETDVYYLSSLPVVIEPINFVVIALAALVICFGATLYPAWEAARLDPVEGLRYE